MATTPRKYDAGRRIDILVNKINDVLKGDTSLVFLDTGAVIDFEVEIIGTSRLKDKSFSPSTFYSLLQRRLPKIFVTEHALQEIHRHQLHRISRHPEISSETFDIVFQMHVDYIDFIRQISAVGRDLEQVRYDVYWAGKMAFEADHKKCCKDPISLPDREQIAAALWCRYTYGLNSHGNERPVTSSVIISPDCHFTRTVEFLTRNLEYDSIGVVTSR